VEERLARATPLVILLAGFAWAPGALAQEPADSTARDTWRLDNGLQVRTLDLPGATAIAVTIAFRAGSGYEPAGLEGLSELLAEVQFTGPAGDVPERTREEMPSLRPLGWESRPGTRLVRFTEIATRAQLPGVLQQVARRLAGVTPTDTDVRRALADVRRDVGSRLFGEPADVLYWRPAAMARGFDDQRLVRLAGLAALDRMTAAEVTPWLRRWYHAGNASLAIAGDLSGLDLRGMVGSLFGALPGSQANPDTVQLRLQGARRSVPWKDLTEPLASIAVVGPPLTDSLHPGFYAGMLITGPALSNAWGGPKPPLRSRFQYSILDEPELVRFYPPAPPNNSDPAFVAGALHEMLVVIGGQQVVGPMIVRMKRSVRWLLGGELPPDVRARMRSEPGGLGTLSNGLATRALWMGDAFWGDYLARFDRTLIGHNVFYPLLTEPARQSTLLLTPRH
jgi:hypothetical protein